MRYLPTMALLSVQFLAVRPGDAAAVGAANTAAVPPSPAQQLRVSLAAATYRDTSFLEGGYPNPSVPFDAGLQIEYLRALGWGWRWGLGARYSYGIGRPKYAYYGEYESEHVVFVPLLLGWAGRSQTTGAELEIRGGVGVGGLYSYFSLHDNMSWADGFGGEVSVSYIRPFNPNVALVVGASARLLILSVRRSISLDRVGNVLHGEIPVSLGLRFTF